MDRRSFLATTALATSAAAQTPKQEWRNKQSTMSYRQLGRTGLMISEVVSGGDPITLRNYEHLNVALELGLNYLDMAPAYNRGDTERAYGKLIAGSSKRGKVFLATKVSSLQSLRNNLYKQLFDSLPGDKQAVIRKRATDMIAERGTMKPGYFIDYYPGQRNQVPPAFLSNAMARDYAQKVDGRQVRDFIVKSVEGSLQRVGVDHFDILMCPHGACCAEELEIPEIHETFLSLRQAGKVRFLGLTSHTGPGEVLRKAAELGYYDCMMHAYNYVNGGYVEHAIQQATAKGMGIIGMKVAMPAATHHKALQPVPRWRVELINRIVPGEMKPPLKAYLWALQNPRISAVISNLWDETHVRENLGLAGRQVEFGPA